MKKIYLACFMLMAFGACKKSTIIDDKGIEILPREIPLTVHQITAATVASQEGDANYNFLGYGYDVTDQFDDANAVRAAVLNIPNFAAGNASRVDLSRSTQFYFNTNIATDAADFSAQLSDKLEQTKGMKLFKNSLVSKVKGDDVLQDKYVYGNYTLISQFKRIRFNQNDGIESYFTTVFNQDVAKLAATDLVKKYGTHVLRDIQLGAKLNVIYQAETNKQDRRAVAAAGFNFAMKKVFGLFTGALDPIDLAALNANSSAKIYYEAVGGDVAKLQKLDINGNTVINITNWSGSQSVENAKFIRVSEDGLIPLYDLIIYPVKKAEVKAFILQYITSNQTATRKS